MIDIIIAVVIILFIIVGYKNGFMKSVYRVSAFVLGIVLAYVLYRPVKNLFINSGLMDKVNSGIRSLSDSHMQVLNENILPGYMKSMVANGQVSLSDAVSGFLTTLVINVLAFLFVFLAVRLLIALLGRVIHITSRLPVINFFNRGLGVVLGIAEGIMLIYLVLAFVYAVTPLRENPVTVEYINASPLTKTMYENNPVIDLISPTDYESLIQGGNYE